MTCPGLVQTQSWCIAPRLRGRSKATAILLTHVLVNFIRRPSGSGGGAVADAHAQNPEHAHHSHMDRLAEGLANLRLPSTFAGPSSLENVSIACQMYHNSVHI